MNTAFEKLKVTIRYWLLGRKFHNALRAMEFGLQYHKGKRKGGDPEFIHQLQIVSYLRTIPTIEDKDIENLLAAAFLHDVSEDYGVSIEEITDRFGWAVGHLVSLMTKDFRGNKISKDNYFKSLSGDALGALLKGADRISNQNSMIGVFSLERMKSYIEETETYIIPMLKDARRLVSEHEEAFENEKLILQTQIVAIKEIIRLLEEKENAQKLYAEPLL